MSITSKGLQEIREIRDRWAEMPEEEASAEQRKSYLSGMRRLTRIEKQKEAAGEPVGRTIRVVPAGR